MKTYTVIKKGSSIQHCIQIPDEFIEEDLEITIKPYRPKQNIGKKLEQLMKKYPNINPFESIKEPSVWQRKARRDWEESSV
jgi:hypothetical protein